MTTTLRILDSLDIGIALFSTDGKLQYANNYCQFLFLNKDINLFNIFTQTEIKKLLTQDFHMINKLYNNFFIMLFKQESTSSFFLIFKEKKFFSALFDSGIPKKYAHYHDNDYSFDNILGKSPSITNVINQCKQIANQNTTVLITGESGTGKEFFARAIHNSSSRSNYPFIPINCGAIPKSLIESELFGYDSGAFTGANKQGHIGKFELANGGTIFLDEIGEMPLNMQVSLLRVLQDKCVTKIGSNKCSKIDVRIIAATNKDLQTAIKENKFRKDLFYRLNTFNIQIPSLKNRIGDIPIFLEYFLKEKSMELNKPIPKMSKELFQKIISYCWPGNIRELQNFVENFVALDGISTYDINFDECHCMTHDNLGNKIKMNNNIPIVIDSLEDNSKTSISITTLADLEKNEIEKALLKFDGNITQSAIALGISRNALYQKIKKYNIYRI